jgi:hypothetical protein
MVMWTQCFLRYTFHRNHHKIVKIKAKSDSLMVDTAKPRGILF